MKRQRNWQTLCLIQGLNKEQFSPRIQTLYNQNSVIIKEFKIVETKAIDNTHAKRLQSSGKAQQTEKTLPMQTVSLPLRKLKKWKIDINDILAVTKAKKQMSWNISDG